MKYLILIFGFCCTWQIAKSMPGNLFAEELYKDTDHGDIMNNNDAFINNRNEPYKSFVPWPQAENVYQVPYYGPFFPYPHRHGFRGPVMYDNQVLSPQLFEALPLIPEPQAQIQIVENAYPYVPVFEPEVQQSYVIQPEFRYDVPPPPLNPPNNYGRKHFFEDQAYQNQRPVSNSLLSPNNVNNVPKQPKRFLVMHSNGTTQHINEDDIDQFKMANPKHIMVTSGEILTKIKNNANKATANNVEETKLRATNFQENELDNSKDVSYSSPQSDQISNEKKTDEGNKDSVSKNIKGTNEKSVNNLNELDKLTLNSSLEKPTVELTTKAYKADQTQDGNNANLTTFVETSDNSEKNTDTPYHNNALFDVDDQYTHVLAAINISRYDHQLLIESPNTWEPDSNFWDTIANTNDTLNLIFFFFEQKVEKETVTTIYPNGTIVDEVTEYIKKGGTDADPVAVKTIKVRDGN